MPGTILFYGCNYKVDASVSGGHGTVTEATQNVDSGDAATIHINPDAGYHIGGITDNGEAAIIASPTSYRTLPLPIP